MTEFRKMRRFKQQLPEEETKELLRTQKRGVLSVLGDNGYPYGVPIDFLYSEEDNAIYFHGAAVGHKMDAIRTCDKASFCIYDEGYRNEGDWALNIRSVIVFGRIHVLEDRDQVLKICTTMCGKFNDDPAYPQHEIATSGRVVQVLELKIKHMTGKKVHES